MALAWDLSAVAVPPQGSFSEPEKEHHTTSDESCAPNISAPFVQMWQGQRWTWLRRPWKHWNCPVCRRGMWPIRRTWAPKPMVFSSNRRFLPVPNEQRQICCNGHACLKRPISIVLWLNDHHDKFSLRHLRISCSKLSSRVASLIPAVAMAH